MTNILLTGRLLDVGQTVTQNLAQGGDEAGRAFETARELVLDRAAPGLAPGDAGRR